MCNLMTVSSSSHSENELSFHVARLMLVMDSWRENAAIMSRNVKNVLGACEELKSSEALRRGVKLRC